MRFFIFVINGLGVGNLSDVNSRSLFCNSYDDINKKLIINTTNLKKLGICSIDTVQTRIEYAPLGSYGKARTSGISKGILFDYLELMGYKQKKINKNEFGGLCNKSIKRLEKKVGLSFLCNKKYENLKAIEDYGDEHIKTGRPIINISEDNILQLTANLNIMTKERLFEIAEKICENLTLDDGISKVVARPFYSNGNTYLRTLIRKDCYFKPSIRLDIEKFAKKYKVIMMNDFANIFEKARNIHRLEVENDDDAMGQLLNVFELKFDGLVFCNISQLLHYGKKHDVTNYGMELERIDRYIYSLIGKMGENDNVIILGNHSANPTISSFQTGIEYSPILAIGPQIEKNYDLKTLNYDEIFLRVKKILEEKAEKF